MQPRRSKSLVLDVLGAFVRDVGGWIAIADLVSLMAELGVDDQTVRSSVSRLTRKGMLRREARNGQAGYSLTPPALDILAEGDSRIFRQVEPAPIADGWVLVTFSVPEQERAERHQLRNALRWLCYGNLGPGLWIAPRRILEPTMAAVEQLGLADRVDIFEASYCAFGELDQLVNRCWQLGEVRDEYRAFIDEFGPVAERWRELALPPEPAAAFRDYVSALHIWRKLPYLDPGLPLELLPGEWEGKAAAELFSDIRSHLEDAARRYVERVVAGS